MTEQTASGLNWAEKLLIATSSVMVSLDFSAVAPVLPKMREVFAHYPNVDFLVKMLIGIIGASMVVGCPVGGWLAKRFNHRILMVVSLVVYAISGGLGLVISDLYTLLGTRCVVGFAAAVGSTVALVMLSERAAGHTRNFWMGMLISVSMLSTVISYPLAGFLGEMNWHFPYGMYFYTLPLAVICLLYVRDVDNVEHGADSTISDQTLRIKFNRLVLLLPLLFLAVTKGLVTYIPTIYVPFHMDAIGIKDPRLIGIGLTTSTIVGAIGSSMYGLIRRKLDIYQSLCLALFAAAIGIAIVATSTTMTGVVGGLFIYGIGLSWQAANVFAIAALLPASERSVGLGLTKACGYSAAFIGVILFEPFYEFLGADGVLVADSCLALALIVYVLIYRESFSDRSQKQTATARS